MNYMYRCLTTAASYSREKQKKLSELYTLSAEILASKKISHLSDYQVNYIILL